MKANRAERSESKRMIEGLSICGTRNHTREIIVDEAHFTDVVSRTSRTRRSSVGLEAVCMVAHMKQRGFTGVWSHYPA